MRKIVLLLMLLIPVLSSFSQRLAGTYTASGYFFHPSTNRAFNFNKTITAISPNRYQLDLGDLGANGFSFQFELNDSNQLVNWTASGSTPAAPASGFMTADNPGGFTYAVSPPPGTVPYVHDAYNNRYDPVTNIFHLHYGYAVGSTGETGYSRQVYETLTLIPPPGITSVTPLTGTAGTLVTIRGNHFTGVNPAYNIRFGASNSDSAVVVSDSVILAWVGSGASGSVIVSNNLSSDTFPGFVYEAVSPVTTQTWQYLGSAGFSANRAYEVNAGLDKNNIPFTAFVDSSDRRIRVMKYDGNAWTNVGDIASAGKSSGLKMTMDTSGYPVLLFSDSSNNGYLAVKRFDGNNWIDCNLAAQFPRISYHYSLTVDRQNEIYVCWHANDTFLSVAKYNGTVWSSAGYVPAIASSVSLAIGKDNMPYILHSGNTGYPYTNQACVTKLTAGTWTPVGTRGFTNGVNGMYYPTLKMDTAGLPVVALQEDDGFERLSVFSFDGSGWDAAYSRKFNRGRTYSITQAIGTDNKIAVGYVDNGYNNRGTVLSYNRTRNRWDTVGARGAIPCQQMEATALQKDSRNNLFLAFADINQGGRVSVLKMITNYVWTGVEDNRWENPDNWTSGAVPTGSSDVVINSGATVVINSQAMVNSIIVHQGAVLTVTPGNTLTITGP